MNPYLTQHAKVPISERLSLRMLGLFIGSFLAVFVGSWIYDTFASFATSRAAEASIVVQPAAVVIDPNLQTELAKVMAFSEAPLSGEIRDPFNDRAGISGVARSSLFGGSQQATEVAQSGIAAAESGGTGAAIGRSSTSQGDGGVGREPVVTALEATKLRYANWLEQARLGAIYALDPQIFAVEDLMPVGVVSGGDGGQEVLFYSQVADRTISFPVGTRFNDGWLSELRPDGVVFAFWDERRTIRLRIWSRATRPLAGG